MRPARLVSYAFLYTTDTSQCLQFVPFHWKMGFVENRGELFTVESTPNL